MRELETEKDARDSSEKASTSGRKRRRQGVTARRHRVERERRERRRGSFLRSVPSLLRSPSLPSSLRSPSLPSSIRVPPRSVPSSLPSLFAPVPLRYVPSSIRFASVPSSLRSLLRSVFLYAMAESGPKMHDVFLCYAHADRPVVHALSTRLERAWSNSSAGLFTRPAFSELLVLNSCPLN